MKKRMILFPALASLLMLSCRQHGDVSISLSESERYYSMKAFFAEDRTAELERYMDEKLGDRSNISFLNTEMDGQLTLDDRTSFYLKKFPGRLELKLNKYKNSVGAYRRVKALCEGISEKLAH